MCTSNKWIPNKKYSGVYLLAIWQSLIQTNNSESVMKDDHGMDAIQTWLSSLLLVSVWPLIQPSSRPSFRSAALLSAARREHWLLCFSLVWLELPVTGEPWSAELGVFCVISAFRDTTVAQNAEITRKTSSADMMQPACMPDPSHKLVSRWNEDAKDAHFCVHFTFDSTDIVSNVKWTRKCPSQHEAVSPGMATSHGSFPC